MSDPSPRGRSALAARLCLGLSNAGGARAEDGKAAGHPVVPGFERLNVGPKPDAAEAGLLLLGDLNRMSCHRADKGIIEGLALKHAPILDGVGSRVRPSYLRSFPSAPHEVKPGTTMPDWFSGWPKAEKAEAVETLTHFLASTGGLPLLHPDAYYTMTLIPD
jgi:hypothetical protein